MPAPLRIVIAGLILALTPAAPAADAAATELSLVQAIARAQSGSPDARLARHQALLAEIRLAQTTAAWHPQIGASIGYSWMDHPMHAFGAILNQEAFTPGVDFNDTPTVDHLQLGLEARYQLYDGGRRRSQHDAAAAGVLAASAAADSASRRIGLAGAATWLQAYQAHRQQTAALAMRDALRAHLATAQDLRQEGILVATDVLEVEVRLHEAEEQVLRAANHFRRALAMLANIIGADAPPAISPDLPTLPTIGDAAPRERPALIAARAELAAAREAVRATAAGHRPSLGAVGAVAYHDGTELEAGDGRTTWMAGLELQVTVWDGLLTANRVAEAEAAVLVARERERRAALQIELERVQAQLDLTDADQRRMVAGRAHELAGRHVALTAARFTEGLATVTQLIDAEAARTAASIRASTAAAELVSAQLRLRHALGLPLLPDASTPTP